MPNLDAEVGDGEGETENDKMAKKEEEEDFRGAAKSEDEKLDSSYTATHFVLDNIYVVAPLIFIGSLAIGIVFYMLANGWDFALAYYYAASVLLGALYLVPAEPNPISPVFTQWYFLWGTTLIMGAIAAMANEMLNNASRVAAEERKRIILSLDAGRQNEEGEIENLISSFSERLVYHRKRLLDSIGWTSHRTRYTVAAVALLCYSVGVLYGVFFEGWTFSHAAFFSLSAMSASGTSPPVCDNGDDTTCRLGTLRSLLVGTYLVFAVPIFTYTMGQFAEILVERAIRTRERMLMTRPLTDSEFRFAMALQDGLRGGAVCPPDADSDSHSLGCVDSFPQEVRLDLGDFIVLELLRLKKITKHDLDYIKDLFDMLDSDGDGVLIRPAMSTRRPFASHDEMDSRTAEFLETRSQRSQSFHRFPSRDARSKSVSAPATPPPAFSRSPMLEREMQKIPSTDSREDDRWAHLTSLAEEGDRIIGTPPMREDTFPSTAPFSDLVETEEEREDEREGGEEALHGGISQGYNALVLPVLRQLSQRPSTKQQAARRSRLQHSTVLAAATRLKAMSSAARRQRRLTAAGEEHVPLLYAPKRHYSTSDSIQSADNEV